MSLDNRQAATVQASIQLIGHIRLFEHDQYPVINAFVLEIRFSANDLEDQ